MASAHREKSRRKIKHETSTYDRDFFLRKRGKWPQFRKLKVATVLNLFRQRSSFQYIKRVALDRLEKTIYDQLDVLMLADPFDYTYMEQVSHGVFSWRKKEFLRRMRMKKTIWVDVLKMIANKDLLMRFKIRTDLKEIKALIKAFFDGIRDLNEFDMTVFDAEVNEPMREIQTFANILSDLQEENIVLMQDYKDLKLVVNTRIYPRNSAHQETILEVIEEAVLNAIAWVPIEMRYQISWYRTSVSMMELKKALMEKCFTDCIQQKQFETQVETTRGTSLHDICNDLSEIFKYQIQHFQTRYDAEVEDIENDMNYTRLQIKKLDEHRKFLNKEIERFHVEIKQCLDKEAAERQAKIDAENERLRLEQQAKLEEERKEKARAKREKQKQKQKQKQKAKIK